MTERQNNVALAVGFLMLAMVLFDAMGLIIKYLSPRYSAAELSAYRNFFGIFPAAIALWSSRSWHAGGRLIRIRQWKLGLVRGAYVAIAQLLFYFSLAEMPFATATTVTHSNSIFMVALAVPMLGERVGLVRWSAVLIGFAGVVMVMGLGRDVFAWVVLAPLGAAFFYALAGVSARLMDSDLPTPLINLYSVIAALIGSLLLAFYIGGFSPIENSTDAIWIVAMGALGGCAVLSLVAAYRSTEQSNLAPFHYFSIPIAFLAGWLVFGETPFDDLLPGALLIVAGGLVVVWRERRLARGARA